MTNPVIAIERTEIQLLLELSERVGHDPLLAQASTGNGSVKLDGVLWIKASGKWMLDARGEDFLVPLPLDEVRRSIQNNVDPKERYPNASIETAMHAVLPHRVVLHVHCADTIAWAVRDDAPVQLECQLHGLPWRWCPYMQSGLPLARAIERVLPDPRPAEVLVLGNHGLVIGGDTCREVEYLLSQVRQRLAIRARPAHPPDYAALMELADRFSWDLPEDDAVHALGTDEISAAVVASGFLYPCQAIFSHSTTPELFRAVACSDLIEPWTSIFQLRPFLIIKGRGVILSPGMTVSERALLGGLVQVVQRLGAETPVRYLTNAELAGISSVQAYRYLELANARHAAAG